MDLIRKMILLRYLYPEIFLGLWMLVYIGIGLPVLIYQDSPWFWYQLLMGTFSAFVSGSLFMAQVPL